MTPNTTVTLYATDFDISNRYVIAANSTGEALAIVSAYPSITFDNCYWQRTDSFIFRCNGNINEIEQYNYCVFVNNGKYNFAFITKCQYVNDAMTWVYLEIDPWLNFAGQYTFHNSPMIRCHPPDDSQRNYYTEPIEVEKWNIRKETFGDPGTADVYKLCLVTKLNALSYTQMSVADALTGVMDIINGNGIATYQTFLTSFQSGGTLIVGLHPQAPTYLGTMSEIANLMKKILQVGRESDILGAYYVPSHVMNDTSSGYKPTMQPFATILPMTSIPPDSQYHWKKMSYSEQFNRLSVNVCGNITYIPYNEFLGDLSSLNLHIAADPGQNGCIYCWFDNSILNNANAYMMHSAKWDTVQLSGYAVNETAFIGSGLGIGKTAFDTVSRTISNAMSLDFAGLVGDLGGGAIDIANQGLNALEIIKSGGYAGGQSLSSMAAFNMNYPLVTLTHEHMFNDSKLDEMFGTYGYTQNGDIMPITFKNLPYWSFYHCKDAAIDGRQVPQKYLSQIINRFNSGIFVFNDVASFKKFERAQSNHY